MLILREFSTVYILHLNLKMVSECHRNVVLSPTLKKNKNTSWGLFLFFIIKLIIHYRSFKSCKQHSLSPVCNYPRKEAVLKWANESRGFRWWVPSYEIIQTGYIIQDHIDLDAAKELMNLIWVMIHCVLWQGCPNGFQSSVVMIFVSLTNFLHCVWIITTGTVAGPVTSRAPQADSAITGVWGHLVISH